MALSDKLKARIRVAITDQDEAAELIAAIEASVGSPAASVAAMGATTNLVGVDGTGSNAAPLAGTESRLDAIEAKVDQIIAGQKASGQMST